MADAEKQATVAILKQYERKFDEILDLTRGKSSLAREEKQRARELLRQLKDDLKTKCHELRRRERRGELNKTERAYLHPAIAKATANILTRANTIPGENWFQELSGAKVDISWTLSNLEKKTA